MHLRSIDRLLSYGTMLAADSWKMPSTLHDTELLEWQGLRHRPQLCSYPGFYVLVFTGLSRSCISP